MPLKSLKVLDFSTLLPGPYATMMFADMGAEVLRIESPTRPDLTRMLTPHDNQGTSYIHRTLNRSKQSLSLDLKNKEAVDLIKRLISKYDVLIEQFRPGVMKRLGLDYETLKAVNPKLIYCSITGFGQTGPYKDRAGHDINYLSIAGTASYTGTKDSGPLPIGFQIADIAGGSMHCVTGVLAAVIDRTQSGKGQYIDISMTDTAFALNAMAGAQALGSKEAYGQEASVLNGGSFYNHYQTKDGRYFSVGSIEPQFMQQLCVAIGKPELAKNGVNYSAQSQGPLIAALTEEFKKHDFSYWQDIFIKLDACVEPTLDIIEASQHPHIKARNMVVNVPSLDGESIEQIANPIKFSNHQAQYKFSGCVVGQHNENVLEALGLSISEIERLKKNKVLG